MHEIMYFATSFAALLSAPAVIFALSRFSGWNRLSTLYPCDKEQPRPRKVMGYGVFRRWIGYNGCIMVSGNARGLFLFPLPVLLSWCHDPIFIPWSEIVEVRFRKDWYSAGYGILTRRAPGVDLSLRKGTFEFVRGHAVGAGVKVVE